MGYSFVKPTKLNISFRSDYRKATFGLFHVAFVDNNDNVVLCSEDKPSLEASLDFYQHRILNRKKYPLSDGKVFFDAEPETFEVLSQVLGLPEEALKNIDVHQDILSQLRFVDGLFDLKKQCYILIYKNLHRKWFNDDFKLYCLSHGVFFLYDETKPFVERDDHRLPVFIDESRLDATLRRLYAEAKSERFAIDFLGTKDDKQFNAYMKKFDAFSFDRRLSYFVNNDYDEELADIQADVVFKRKYSYLLRQYLASLINVLYDDYCFKVLNKVTAKLSFLTSSAIHTDRDIESLSSFNADMFSFDGKNYFFAVQERELIHDIFYEAIEEDPGADILTIYAHSGLPYYGYQFVFSMEDVRAEDILVRLPFTDQISSSELYLSSKRFDVFYSYLSGEKEHRYAFLLRLLLKEGIQYSSLKPLLVEDKENQVTIRVKDASRDKLLMHLFDQKRCSFLEEIYPSYLMEKKKVNDEKLEEILDRLDHKSHQSALSYFYHAFHDYTLNRVIELMLVTFDLQDCNCDELVDFLSFALTYPLVIVEKKYRLFCLKTGDTLSLIALDGLPKQKDSYEPNMPLPYVSFGKLAYSFRKSYFSKSYLCECQKDAIESKINYLRMVYRKSHPKETFLANENEFVLNQLGLPNDIVNDINLNKELVAQLPYKKHICHECLHSVPSTHEHIDSNEEEAHNIYLTYIRARASKMGLYFNEAMSLEYDMASFFDAIANKTYHSLLSFDRNKIDPVLLPYINVSKEMIVSLIAAFFPNDMSYGDFYEEVVSFIDLGETRIQKLMFDCSEREYGLIYSHMMIFTRLVYLYKMIEISYALYVSDDITPRNENELCLNFEYNPLLPHPYVILGNVYNAYCDSLDSNNYYLCQCDYSSMKEFASRFDALYNERNMRKDIKTPIILGLLGLPYLVILKYSTFDLSNNTIDDLFARMDFKESICRREVNVNHSAYEEPFRKVFPNKDDMTAEFDFAANAMVHDHFRILSDKPLSDIFYRSSHRYDLDGYDDSYLPYFDYSSSSIPESLFTFFVMGKDTLRDYLFEYAKLDNENAEVNAYASGIILDTIERDDKAILNFLFDLTSSKTLREEVASFFPEIERVRGPYLNAVMQSILGFVTFLIENLIRKYAVKESHVGK